MRHTLTALLSAASICAFVGRRAGVGADMLWNDIRTAAGEPPGMANRFPIARRQ